MTQSAVAKVFATPELLEHILCIYAHDNATTIPYGVESMLEPVAALFIWQRIDRTTQKIISGSSKLRRLMLIDPVQEGSEESKIIYDELQGFCRNYEIIAPLWWLIILASEEKSTRRDGMGTYGSGEELDLDWVYVDESFKPRRLMEGAMADPKATWRSIRMRWVTDETETIRVCLHFGLSDDFGWYEDTFELRRETTLGEWYDWYAESLGRTFAQHQRSWRDLMETGERDSENFEMTVWKQGSLRAGAGYG